MYRFGKRGKLSPRFVGPFEILEKIGVVAYRLALPPTMNGMHDVFHVSQLRKYVYHQSHILRYEEIEFQPDGTFEESSVRILGYEERKLRNKVIPLVRIL